MEIEEFLLRASAGLIGPAFYAVQHAIRRIRPNKEEQERIKLLRDIRALLIILVVMVGIAFGFFGAEGPFDQGNPELPE